MHYNLYNCKHVAATGMNPWPIIKVLLRRQKPQQLQIAPAADKDSSKQPSTSLELQRAQNPPHTPVRHSAPKWPGLRNTTPTYRNKVMPVDLAPEHDDWGDEEDEHFAIIKGCNKNSSRGNSVDGREQHQKAQAAEPKPQDSKGEDMQLHADEDGEVREQPALRASNSIIGQGKQVDSPRAAEQELSQTSPSPPKRPSALLQSGSMVTADETEPSTPSAIQFGSTPKHLRGPDHIRWSDGGWVGRPRAAKSKLHADATDGNDPTNPASDKPAARPDSASDHPSSKLNPKVPIQAAASMRVPVDMVALQLRESFGVLFEDFKGSNPWCASFKVIELLYTMTTAVAVGVMTGMCNVACDPVVLLLHVGNYGKAQSPT